MASLCISPVQAGIRPLSTANSSFILDRRRRSIRLCAVFRAIFRPAALVADGCFFLPPPLLLVAFLFGPFTLLPLLLFFVPVGGANAADGGDDDGAGASAVFSSCTRGFIWMILRDRVGGGGKAKASFWCCCCCWAADERLLDFTVSLGCVGNSALGDDDVLL